MSTSRPNLEPGGPASPRQRVEAFAAALALLALVAGVPILLAAFLGNPLPSHLPSLADVHDGLARPLPQSTVVGILAFLAWLAWAHLLVSVLVEAVAQLTGLPSPRRLPILGMNQALAQRLVAAVLLLVPATGSTLQPVAAITRAATSYPAGPVAVAAAAAAPGLPTTQRLLATVDGAVASPRAPRELEAQAGTRARPHKVYVVQPPHGRHYDSLWDIAERHLGDGRRYHEIYELNRGRPQPGGGELTRASLIQPGWTLLLPPDATGPGVVDPDMPPSVAPERRPAAPERHDEAPSREPDTPVAGVPAQATPPTDPAGLPRGLSSPGPRPTADDPSASAPRSHDTGAPVTPISVGLGLGSLAALAALGRARRVAQRRRGIGERLAPVPLDLRAVEAGLRFEARQVEPVAGAVRLATALAGQGVDRLDVRAALRHDSGDIELLLEEPPPAAPPFTTTDRGWRLPPDASGFTFAVSHSADPMPALAHLGRAEDAEVYVDLEPLGLLAIDGDEHAVDDLLATLASRLAGAPWGGRTRVVVPDRVAGRTGMLERLEVVPDLATGAAELAAEARHVRGHTGASHAQPLVLLVGWRADELPKELVSVAGDPATPLVAVVTGQLTDAAHWRLADGQLTGDELPMPVTVPARPPAADQVAVLIEQTRTAPAVPRDDPTYVELRAEAPPSDTTSHAPAMSVNVLGPVELDGIEMPRRTPSFQTLVYLALHRRGVSAEQLATALWPDEIAASKTVRNRVAEARAVVDGAISGGPGWRLDERVSCDWQRFQALATGSPDDRVAALELVRGQPFDGFTDEWVDTEMFRTDIIAAVIDLAVEVAEQALEDGQPGVAFRAARAGLRASPYEERLFRLAMRAADAQGSTGKLRALMEELRKVLDIHVQPDDGMQQETLVLYEELVSDASRRARA